jgi:isoaspartyl peptidase/L-asparaginase-like protein (Ntn-hydrolase superfamily)
VNYAILTHGGAASPHHFSDGCAAAATRARAVLDAGGDALAAALEATVALEDDPRFNAGTGSNLRLDGQTIEMDASAMASDGRFGAVACLQAVQNPVRVAARVMETPHLLLVGEGATAFARRLGFPVFDPITDGARRKYARAVAELIGEGDGDYAVDAAPWRQMDVAAMWNFPTDPPPVVRLSGGSGEGCDTVGAVVRDRHGRFAATASTGGTLYMLRGRVGDSPLMGAGVYAGPHGAVAATGVGEEIARRFLAKTVYDWLADDVPPARAAQRAVAMFPDVIDVGILVAGRSGQAITSNRNMASATLVG